MERAVYRATPHPVPHPKGEGTLGSKIVVTSSLLTWGEGQDEGLLYALSYQDVRCTL